MKRWVYSLLAALLIFPQPAQAARVCMTYYAYISRHDTSGNQYWYDVELFFGDDADWEETSTLEPPPTITFSQAPYNYSLISTTVDPLTYNCQPYEFKRFNDFSTGFGCRSSYTSPETEVCEEPGLRPWHQLCVVSYDYWQETTYLLTAPITSDDAPAPQPIEICSGTDDPPPPPDDPPPPPAPKRCKIIIYALPARQVQVKPTIFDKCPQN